MKKKLPIYACIITASICLAACGSSPENANSTTESTQSATTIATETTTAEETSTEKTSYGLNEAAQYKDIIVTLTNVTESAGSEFNKPEDGNIFVLAEFTIENNSDKDLSISSMLSFDAYQDGFSTTVSLGALMEKGNSEQLDGSIAAGKKMKGVVGYEVPAEYKELSISVKLDVLSNDALEFIYTK